MKNYLLLMLLLLAKVANSAEFNQAFDLLPLGFERQANLVTQYHNTEVKLDLAYQKKELMFLTASLQEAEASYKNNPVFRFVQGMHAKNMASFEKKQGNVVAVEKWLMKKDEYYIQALELDKEHKPHLSASAYATMKKSLPEKYKQQAIESELKLGGNGENESYYWYLHWSNINELQKQGRIADAEKALQKMRSELAEQGLSADVYHQLVDKAEHDVVERKNQMENTATAEKVKPQKIKPERDHTAFTEENVEGQYYRYLIIIGATMLVLLIVVMLFEIKRRNRK